MDRRVVGWSAGCHMDHPCGWGKFRHSLLEKSLNAVVCGTGDNFWKGGWRKEHNFPEVRDRICHF